MVKTRSIHPPSIHESIHPPSIHVSIHQRMDWLPILSVPIKKDQVTIVLPVLNEKKAIGRVLKEIKVEGYHNVLVVDGYSEDGTVDIVENDGIRVIYQHGKGKGGAIKTSVENVETPFMLVMDGDYSYRAKDIERLLSHAKYYDQIIGARVDGRENISRLHRFGNRVITWLFNRLMGANLSDVCSGIYLLRTDKVREFELKSNGFDVEIELATQMTMSGSVTEVPICYRRRLGTTKVHTWKTGLGLILSVVRLAKKYNPVLLFSYLAATALIPATMMLGWALYLWLTFGRWEFNLLLFGGLLFLFGSQSLIVTTIDLLLKRVEKRISRRLKMHD